MSYRYPHQDDSDENGFGQSLQGPSRPAETQDNPEERAPGVSGLIEEIDDGDDDHEVRDEETDEDEDDQDFHGKCPRASFGALLNKH